MLKLFLVLVLIIKMFLLLVVSLISAETEIEIEPDALRTFEEVCNAHGYLFEAHKVTTEDGYILTLYRIPGRIDVPIKRGAAVVFLQHGLLDLADTWIMNEPSPGFLLADAGFDVWLGNSRGSYHSLEHAQYNHKSDSQYWQFTWQHMADYDIPAAIEFVLNTTRQRKLTYIGHSQGTIQIFAHLASNPEFIKNLNIVIALAPIGTVTHLELEVFTTLKETSFFKVLQATGIYEFLPNKHGNSVFYAFCSLFAFLCEGGIELFADMQLSMDNIDRLPVILAHEPGGTSTLNLEHWQQMSNYEEDKVQKFDYGASENLEKYGSVVPPLYDFTRIPGPIALFSGDKDRLADLTDVKWLESIIPRTSIVYNSYEKDFGHATFLWGKDLSYFQKIIKLARQYRSDITPYL